MSPSRSIVSRKCIYIYADKVDAWLETSIVLRDDTFYVCQFGFCKFGCPPIPHPHTYNTTSSCLPFSLTSSFLNLQNFALYCSRLLYLHRETAIITSVTREETLFELIDFLKLIIAATVALFAYVILAVLLYQVLLKLYSFQLYQLLNIIIYFFIWIYSILYHFD